MRAIQFLLIVAFLTIANGQCFNSFLGVTGTSCLGTFSEPEGHTVLIHSALGNAPVNPYSTTTADLLITLFGRDLRLFTDLNNDNVIGTICIGYPDRHPITGATGFQPNPNECIPGFAPVDVVRTVDIITAGNAGTMLVIEAGNFPPALLPWNNLFPAGDPIFPDLAGVPMEALGPFPLLFVPDDNPTQPVPLGFFIQVVWACSTAAADEGTGRNCASRVAGALTSAPFTDVFNSQTVFGTAPLLALRGQTVCCMQQTGLPVQIGTCINPNVESCCGISFDPFRQQCCNEQRQLIAAIDARCPCFRDDTGVCPVGENCCLFNKYNGLDTDNLDKGACYNPNLQACCDEGTVFEPGVQQCCPINGIQSANIPCPCDDDGDCPFNAHTNTQHICCVQTAPPVNTDFQCDEFTNFPVGASPYPTGNVTYFADRCPGACIDPSYQICCNGNACILNYDRCCNNTCCNQFTETCLEGRRSGLKGNRYNHNNFALFGEDDIHMVFAQCSQIENMNVINAWWIFVLPSALTLLTLLGVGIAIVVWFHVPKLRSAWWEKLVIALAVLEAFLAIPLYWSPLYKYGVTVAIPAIFELTLLAAAADFHGPPEYGDVVPSLAGGYGIASIFQIVALISVLQPFLGNPFFDSGCDNVGDIIPNDRTIEEIQCTRICESVQTHNRPADTQGLPGDIVINVEDICFDECVVVGENDPVPEPKCNTIYLGAFFTLTVTMLRNANECVDFYSYFALDPALRDFDRRDNNEIQTFGYCSPGWLLAILYFDGFIVMVALILLGFSMVAFVTTRMAKQAFKLL